MWFGGWGGGGVKLGLRGEIWDGEGLGERRVQVRLLR